MDLSGLAWSSAQAFVLANADLSDADVALSWCLYRLWVVCGGETYRFIEKGVLLLNPVLQSTELSE
jgi:hypothetical protein